MNKNDIFKSVYEDFFGIESLSRKNEKLAQEIEELTGINPLNTEDIPSIEVNKEKQNDDADVSDEEIKIDKDECMKSLFEAIDNLYIEEKSKELLKKIIEYMRKYDEKIEKEYISFNMCLYSNNKETEEQIVKILLDAGNIFSYIKKNGKGTFITLYDIEKIEQIEKIYNEKNSVVLIKDFESFNKQEADFKDKFLNKFDEYLEKNEKQVLTILNADNKEIIKEAFSGKEDVLRKFSNFEIVGVNPDVQDAYQDVLKKLEANMEVSDDMKIKLLDYVSTTYVNNDLPYPEYRDSLYKNILFNKEIPEYEKEKSMDEIFAELNNLVGLTKVKEMLKDLVNLIELKNKTKDELKIKNVNLHMVFLGNPGTGKTTVARIIAEMLYNLKYVKQNKLIEVSSKDLVAEYVGQTAPKTMAVIQKALGGVLFIDEAYSLASGHGQGNSYNEEAIATLIQAMENYRDEIVVIFAGYTKEMQDFLNANSGIVSRIGYTMEFEDYTTDELIQIFKMNMEKSGFTVTKEAYKKVEDIINEYRDTKNFGNARFVRNIYEKSIVKHASNTKGKKGKKVLKTITEEDINAENLLKM